jgi:hypothetical protein
MADNVTFLHLGNNAIVDVQVGAADRTGRHLDDGIARIFDLGIGHRLVAHIALAVPAQRFHGSSFG